MDLSAYLLESVVRATTPPGETAVDAQARADAITAMLRAYDPATHLEAMMASQCIMMQFLFNAAMRTANNPQLEPAALAKARAEANSASRTLHQWVSKFEKERKRNETLATAAAKAQAAQARAKRAEQTSPNEPVQTPTQATVDPPVARTSAPNGQIPATYHEVEPARATAPMDQAAAAAPGRSGSSAAPAAAQSPPAEVPIAA